MPNDACIFGRVFVFVKELFSSRESDLVDIFFDLFLGHSNTLVYDMYFFSFLIHLYLNKGIAIRYFSFTNLAEVFELKSGIGGVGDQLTEENLMVTI